MNTIQIDVTRIIEIAEKKWWLVCNADHSFIDVLFTDVSGVDMYRDFWLNNTNRTYLIEAAFETEYDLMKHLMNTSNPKEVSAHLKLVKSKIEGIRIVNTIQREHLVNQMIEKINADNKHHSQLDDLTTTADDFYVQLESGNIPHPSELLLFMDKLVDYLEKQGGTVKERAFT